MNRLADAIDKARVVSRDLPPEKLAHVDETMALTFDEHFEYQQTQARAFAMQKITQEEATLIYTALGEVGSDANGGWASGTDTATKVVVTHAMVELIALRVAGRI